ncbi:MAG: hypothetical protein KDJ52_08370 [Anaerolineae bacterium]|nr:hypothetical protein [Anaerolineae bacterium]
MVSTHPLKVTVSAIFIAVTLALFGAQAALGSPPAEKKDTYAQRFHVRENTVIKSEKQAVLFTKIVKKPVWVIAYQHSRND